MTPEELRRTADEVLRRSEFDEPEPNPIQRFVEWLGDRLDGLGGAVGGTGIGRIIGLALLAIAVALLVRWLLTRDWRRSPEEDEVGISFDEVRRRTPAEWRAEADELEARGEWKLGLRARYRALVGDLLAERLVDDVVGLTTGELRAEVAANAPERASDFSAASDLFDLAWYAGRDTGPEESARFQALAASVTGARR